MSTRPTRRAFLATAASVGLAATAGCGQSTGSASERTGTRRTSRMTATPTASSTPTSTPTADADAPTEVCMEPVGCLSFDTPPETWVANAGIYCDMGVALGLTDRLAAIGSPRRYYTGYYDELPGVSLDKAAYPALARGTRMPKESFYAADADVHVIDPVWMINTFSWTEADVEEIATNVGPFFGNYIRERQDAWHTYRYYGLWAAFEKVATLFDRRRRYERLRTVGRELTETIRSRVPDERTEILLLRPQGVPPRSFFPQYMDESVSDYQWQVVPVADALDGSGIPEWGVRVDYEVLAELDPSVIVMETQFADDFVLDRESFEEYTLGVMREHPVARGITAVEEGRVHAGGINYQGPLISLFQTERAAQVAYPEEFGDERLFDRDRVAGIVTGEGD
jgi:iron complex transport system substrate-binding protein